MADYDTDGNGRLSRDEYYKLAKASFYDSDRLGDSLVLKIALAICLKMFVFPYVGIGAKRLLIGKVGASFMEGVPDPVMATAFETLALSLNSFR